MEKNQNIFEIIVNIFVISVALMLHIIALGYTRYSGKSLGAGTFPRIITTILIVFSLVNVIRAIRDIRVSNYNESKSKGTELSIKERISNFIKGRVFLSIIAIILYYFGLEYIGFIVSSILYIIGMLFLMHYNGWIWKLIIAIAATSFIYLTFGYLLKVPLPRGILI